MAQPTLLTYSPTMQEALVYQALITAGKEIAGSFVTEDGLFESRLDEALAIL